MNGKFTFAAESFESGAGAHQSFEWQQEDHKSNPAWQAAWRFASAIHKQGFLPMRHFIDRIAQRAIGEGNRFDPRTFRQEFFRAHHYKQARPGYNNRIAVVRDIPILYVVGGRSGKDIVLTGALNPGKLPPVERINPPKQQEAEMRFERMTEQAALEAEYAHLDGADGFVIGPGRKFAPGQKNNIYKANRANNGGVLKSDDPNDPYYGQVLLPPQRSVSRGMGGTGQPPNMASIDHVTPRSKGGTNQYANAKVVSIKHNRDKLDK